MTLAGRNTIHGHWELNVKKNDNNTGEFTNLRAIVSLVRKIGIQVFIVPHKRWEAADYQYWSNPTQLGIMERHAFAKGTWGGEWHPDFAPQEGDILVKEHWAQSGFANTIELIHALAGD